MKDSVTWKIGGEAGFGIMSAGTMLAKMFTRQGYHIFVTNEYPSLIRGGHNLITVRIATKKFHSMDRNVHILVALNKETVTRHKDELGDGAIVVFDPKDYDWKESEFAKKVKLIKLPLIEIVHSLKGEQVMRNTVALGATLALLGAEFSIIEAVLKRMFKRKGEDVVAQNVGIAKAGYDFIVTNFKEEKSVYLAKVEKKDRLLVINASEIMGIGAVRAGLKFAAIYPMTPINALISFLADHAGKFGVVYKQPEDEIAGINMAIGASVAGVRSMVATSGGGFALQVEGLALAGMMEVPLVIDLGMRVGPATGMPTWTEQGELQFAIHAGHGEFARIILAPSDAEEVYKLTIDAFNLADKYQVPVFVLTDKYLNESHWCVPASVFSDTVHIDRGKLLSEGEVPTDGSYKRYDLSAADGISARTRPGMKNGFFYANSYEHDEVGHVTEDGAKRTAMANKRLKKLEAIKKDVRAPMVYGDTDADITLVSWGSSRGPILDALEALKTAGKRVNLVHFTWLFPFPTEEATKLLGGAKRLVDIEQNATGQLASLIREHTGILIKDKILKYDGRPFYPEEIVEKLS